MSTRTERHLPVPQVPLQLLLPVPELGLARVSSINITDNQLQAICPIVLSVEFTDYSNIQNLSSVSGLISAGDDASLLPP